MVHRRNSPLVNAMSPGTHLSRVALAHSRSLDKDFDPLAIFLVDDVDNFAGKPLL